MIVRMISLAMGLADPQMLASVGKFNCGSEEWSRNLSVYLRKYAWRDEQALVTSTYLAVDEKYDLVGYVNLSWVRVKKTGPAADRVLIEGIPYQDLPALFLARLAVSSAKQGQRAGHSMMDWVDDVADASSVAVRFIALHTDEANSRAIGFYEGRGFFVAEHIEEKHQVLMLRDLFVFRVSGDITLPGPSVAGTIRVENPEPYTPPPST